MTIELVHQAIALALSAFGIYFSQNALDACRRFTKLAVKLPHIVSVPAYWAIFLHILGGGSLHWSGTLILAAYTLHLYSERRRPNPTIVVNPIRDRRA